MSIQSDIRPAACPEYESLLHTLRLALDAWKNRRAEICHSGRKGRRIDDELRILQANFAKAYTCLQTHSRDCELCQLPVLVPPGLGIHPARVSFPLHH